MPQFADFFFFFLKNFDWPSGSSDFCSLTFEVRPFDDGKPLSTKIAEHRHENIGHSERPITDRLDRIGSLQNGCTYLALLHRLSSGTHEHIRAVPESLQR